jgi:hypothetical protein
VDGDALATQPILPEGSGTMSSDAPSPLTPEQQRELHEAKERAASFLGAAKVAAFNGWSIGFFAGVSILFGIFSLTGLLVGIGLAVVARNEFVGGSRIRALDASGLELLWRNQVGLMALILAYCLWSMYRASAAPDQGMAELTEVLGGDTGQLITSLTLTLYGAVIVATGIFQGLNARYYFVRIARMREYLHLTPEWVLDVQRSLALE